MKIDLYGFLKSFVFAADYVEQSVIRINKNHAKRIAVLVEKMAEHAGMDAETRRAFACAGLLHDSALADYIEDEKTAVLNEENMSQHCVSGEEIMEKLPFYEFVRSAVLYHHERADGSGAFGKTAEETPLSAQMVHIADVVDVAFSLNAMNPEKKEKIEKWVQCNIGTFFSETCAALFMKCMENAFLSSLEDEQIENTINQILPPELVEIGTDLLKELSALFGEITDFKSHFTWRHSKGVADKAEAMGRFYGYPEEYCEKLYIAGYLHDIGKLFISNDILEKPGKLNPEEYKEIQNHAIGTWEMLKNIQGLEEITRCAALHHEKLDGSGYPFGYVGKDLSSDERLMACLDIYQALVEERPYKKGMPHQIAMEILNKMGNSGQLDQKIIQDIDHCFFKDETIKTEIPKEQKHYQGETWKCPVCGYIHEGPLPENLICPRCEQPASIFEKISD